MAEILDDNERKKLYRKMLAESATSNSTKKYSFNDFEKKLLNDKDLVGKIADLAVKRNWASDDADFYNRYFPEFSQKAAPAEPPAAPIAKPAAPVAVPVAGKDKSFEPNSKKYALVGQPQTGEMDAVVVEGKLVMVPKGVTIASEEEIPEMEYDGKMLPEVTAVAKELPEIGTPGYEAVIKSNPPIGSPEYDYKIAVQNQRPPVELGAGGYGGVIQAPFENKAQVLQEAQSPAFKAQKLAQSVIRGETPLVTQEDVERAQRNFAKATKEQRQAAIMGSSGYEYEQEKKAKERGFWEGTGDLAQAFGALSKRVGMDILSGVANYAQMQAAADPMANIPYEKREQMMKDAGRTMYDVSQKTQKEFQNELAKRNIQTSVYDAIQKGQWGRVPESIAYTVGEAALQMGMFTATLGGGAYFQTLPQEYQRGVEAIAKETNRTPEQVIADGDDAPITASISSGIQYAFEKIGMDQVSKGMQSKGGYRAVRDWLIRNTKNKNLARAGGIGFVSGAEALTEASQTGVSQAAELSTSQKPFMEKVDKFLTDPNYIKERKQAATAGGIGGGFMVGAGRAFSKAFDKGPDITKFSPEVQGNEIIQEAARIYQDNISKAEEQGRKPDAFNTRGLNKLATDPESWVKGEIKYLTQTIQDNKKNNIDSKAEETKLARANALLAQIKAEKKGMGQAALTPAQEAAPVAPQAEAVPAEEVQGTGRRVIVDSLEEVPAEFRDKVIEIKSGPLAKFGVGKKQYAYVVPAETIDIAPQEEEVVDEELQPGERRIGSAIVKTGYVPTMAVIPSQTQPPTAPTTPAPSAPAAPAGIPVPFQQPVLFGDIKLSPQKHIGETIDVEHNGEIKKYTIQKVGTDYVLVTDENNNRVSIPLYEWSRNVNEAIATPAEEAPVEPVTQEEEDEDLLALQEQLRGLVPQEGAETEAAQVAPAEEDVVAAEEVAPAEPVASESTEIDKQKSLELEIEKIKAQIKSLRSEDGSVAPENKKEFDRLTKLLGQAKENATRGDSKYSTVIKIMPEDNSNKNLTFITDANEKAEAADLIEQAIQLSKTWEEAIKKIKRLGYVFDAIDNQRLIIYLKDRFNPNAPRIGNNKDSFQAWVSGKTDAELSTPTEEVVTAEEAVTPVEPAKEVGVGGIIRGHENILGNEGLGDVRSSLPEESRGTIVTTGKDGNQYAVAFSRRGGDGEIIFEQGGSTPRSGHVYTSVKIDNPSNAQEVEQAKKQAEDALSRVLPTIKNGKIKSSAVQEAISSFQSEKAAPVAPAPKAKKAAPAPKQEKKEETPPAPETKPEGKAATPEIGSKATLPPQMKGGQPRTMVYTKEGWKQLVGGEEVLVGEGVQKQAQEAFEGKPSEAKPTAETKGETKEGKVMPTSNLQETAVEIAKAFTGRFGIKVNLIDSKGLQDLLSASENAKDFFFKVLDKIDVFETDNIQEAKTFITTVFQTVESAEDAKKAYRKLAIKYHPDKRGSEEVMKHLNDVNEKYKKGTLGRGTAQQTQQSQASKEQRYKEWAERMSRQYEADAKAYAQSSQMGDEQRAKEAAKAQAEKQAAEAKGKTTQSTQKETKAEQPKPQPTQPTSKIKKGIIESLVEFFTKPFGAEKTTKGEILTFESRSKYKQDAWNKRNNLKEENRKNELNKINENLKNYTNDRITTKQYRENEAAIRSEYANKNKAVDEWYNNTVAAIDKAYEKKMPFAYKQYVGNKVAGLYDPKSLQAYVVLDNIDETTYIHEAFAHPFIEAVRERNNELYNNLLTESKSTQEIVDYVDENYGNAPQQVKDAEYIARAIDLDAKGKLKNKPLIQYVKEFWDEANKIFKDIFGGKGVSIENITPTTKVSDIVDFVLKSGEKLDLTTTTKAETKPSLASQVEEMRTLPPAKRKAMQESLEAQHGKEEVAKMIEITANFTKIIDSLEEKGIVKKDCP